uniref:Phorbol-ester/DAG-type domain-containing protein n=1 Tax=Globodera pallida TaxID=36090 RepID=A0A183CKT7_GLOPA
MSSTDKLLSITKRIDVQESRIQQRDLQQLKERYDQLCLRDSEMGELISREKARNQLQQLEIERRQQQLEESTNTIRRLQEELEARKTANDKKIELEVTLELMKSRTESFQREISDLKAEIKAKDTEIADLRAKQRTVEATEQKREYLDKINQKLGSLEAQNESFRGKVGTLKDENQELTQQAEEDNSALQMQINSLREQLNASEGSTNYTFSRLTDEIERVKQQKAQLRCEHVQLKRKCAELEAETAKFSEQMKEIELLNTTINDLRSKFELVDAEKKAVETETQRLKERLKSTEQDLQGKLDKMEGMVRANEESENPRLKLLQSELDLQRRKCDGMKRAIVELDAQCEKLMTQLRANDADKKKAQSEKELLKREITKLSAELTEKIRMENEMASLKDRNKWLSDKIAYLESELKETSNDHRTELANLADQLVASSEGSSHSEGPEKAPKMEARLRQQEADLRSLQRQLEQCGKEGTSLRQEIDKIRVEAVKTKQENTILRQNFDICLKKAESFKSELEALKEANEQLKSRNEKEENSANDQLYELRTDLEQKEKLIAYLQSEIEMEYKQCLQLEAERNKLKMSLENRRKVLSERQNDPTPTRKEQPDFPSSPTSVSHSQLKQLKQPLLFILFIFRNSSTDSTLSGPRFPGIMRHDIPHRWKRHFVTVATNKCQACLDGLPYFRLVFRCRDCSLTVHPHCLNNVVNTCGLPTECANFYLDTHSISCEKMTGWVKLWRLSAAFHGPDGAARWLNAWAVIDDHRLSFFDTDQLAVSEGAVPFLTIDLDRDHWRIYNQTTEKPLDGVRREEMSLLIELKMPDYILFMLAPTVQAKQRWVQALQLATSRRVFVQRRPSSTIVSNALLLALDKPRDLSINCTVILRDEWLLIGAQEGLFATSMAQQQLRAPFQIAGVSRMYWMELLPEFDMLLAICGSARHLAVVHLQQLHRAFKAEQQPRVYLTNIANIEQCHIAVVSKPEHYRDKRFVYIATIDEIIILHYVVKLGVFSPIKQIKTEEPCTCICSTSSGFIFGADNFHFARFEDNFTMPSPLVVENCPFDFPVAAVEISDNEFLLAFHNFGLFVNSQGKRTRNKNIEWEKVPLEFVYTSPYLYIVYCEFLEVIRVAPYIGSDSSTITDDRNLFKCRSAHRTGHGLNSSEVLFAVSSVDRVELHLFGHADADQHQQQVQYLSIL